jgi:hypothetical protein
MSQKEDFVEVLKSEGIMQDWLDIEYPELPDLPTPGTVEESTRTIAEYCVNCNTVMQSYKGVKPFEIALRAGQRNPALISLLLSSIERIPGAEGAGSRTNFYDFLRTMGFPGDYPVIECFRGIKAAYAGEDVSDIWSALGTWGANVAAWLSSAESQISAAEEAYIAGEPYAESLDLPAIPDITLPVPTDPDSPSLVWQVVRALAIISKAWWFPLAEAIVKRLYRRATQGEQISPLIKILKKSLLVKDGDRNQGYPDYTALLWMAAEKCIEIIISNTGVDAFLDTVVEDEGD